MFFKTVYDIVENMIKGLDGILIGSSDAARLAEFYRDIIGLKQTMEFVLGEDSQGFMFDLGNTTLAILDHSDVEGKNRNPERFMMNLEVSDIEKEVARLDKLKVKKHQDIYHVEDYGYVATFVDPDGNFFQLVQVKAAN